MNALQVCRSGGNCVMFVARYDLRFDFCFAAAVAAAAIFLGTGSAIAQYSAAPPMAAAPGLAAVAPSAASGLQWQPTLEDAKREAARTNRLILVHFWAPWCESCLKLDNEVFAQPQVKQFVDARFVPIKLNADEYPMTARQYGVDRLPTDLVISPDGKIVGRMKSPATPEAYVQQLQIAASGTGPAAQPNTTQFAAGAQPVPSFCTIPRQPQYGAPANVAAQPFFAAQPNIAAQPYVAAPPATNSAPPPAVPAYAGERYAEYFNRHATGAVQGTAPVANTTVSQPALPMQPSYGAPTIPATPYTPNYGPTLNAPAPAPAATTGASVTVNPANPVGIPALGLDGYCPVTVAEQKRWQMGDRRWGVVHRGRTYLFAGPVEQKTFLANPDKYSPAISGNDVVIALDQSQAVDGRRQFGVEYQGRTYLFSSDATRRQFSTNPKRYAAEVQQAERPGQGVLR